MNGNNKGFGKVEISQDAKIWHTTVDMSGRVLLPAELRQSIHAMPGSELVWTTTDDGVKLQKLDVLLASIQDYFSGLSPADELWSEELIAERRDEAARE